MNISRHTNLTRIVPVLTTVLLALCFLPLGEKSGLFRKTPAKAYTATFSETSTYNMIWSQWDYGSGGSTHLYKEIPLVGDGTSTYNVFQMTFAGEYYGGAALQWAVEIMDSSGNTRLYTTGAQYYDVNQMLVVGLPNVTPAQYGQHTDIVYRCHIWVKKKNGGNIERSDMYASNFTWYFNRSEEVEENTLPAEWLETTTYYIDNPLSTVTTVIPSDYDITTQDVDPFLDIPEKITAAMQGCIFWLGRLLNLKYVTFLLCFVLVVGLVAWLIH